MATTAVPDPEDFHIHNITNHTEYPRSGLTTIVLPSIYYFIFLVGFFGNSMAVIVISKLRSSKKIADLFMVNLAIADLIFLGTLPFWATEYAMNGNWVFGRIFCKMASTFTLFSSYGSVFFLSLMAMDRLGVVVFYKRYNHLRSTKKAIAVILILWSAAVTTSLVAVYFRDTYVDKTTGHTHCMWYFDESLQSHLVWYCTHFMLRFVVGFAVPLVITFVCYIIIFIYLRNRRSKKKLLRKKQDRVTLTVMVVIVAFIICWLPNQISNFIYVAQGLEILVQPESPSELQYYIHLFTNTLAWSHSCFNPIVYAFMREDVRHKAMEIASCFVNFETRSFDPNKTRSTKLTQVKRGTCREEIVVRARISYNATCGGGANPLSSPSPQPREDLAAVLLKTSAV